MKPYQPRGLLGVPELPARASGTPTHGDDQYRRGLYTCWQRTFLHPSLLAFDAPSREECTAERPRSNTPQQALVLLNDPTYVEAARVLRRADRARGRRRRRRAAALGVRAGAAAARRRAEERARARRAAAQAPRQYAADPTAADELLASATGRRRADVTAAELAAWTQVARALLNLHETDHALVTRMTR